MQNNQTTSTDKASADKGKTNGKWMTKSAMNEAGEQVAHLSDTAREIYENAVKSGSDMITKANKRAGEVVREYPVQATVGGLIVGFLLGASLFRRRS